MKKMLVFLFPLALLLPLQSNADAFKFVVKAEKEAEDIGGKLIKYVKPAEKVVEEGVEIASKIKPAVVNFKNSHEKGTLGDRITNVKMGGMGYKPLKSKIDQIHGFDSVFVKKEANETIKDLVIIENKANTKGNPFKLADGQMSNEWIDKLIEEMLKHEKAEIRETAELLKNNRDKIRTELWHHDFDNGVIKRYELDDGKIVNLRNVWKDSTIKNEIARQCGTKALDCVPE
jgi:hypothetical protein